MTTAPIVLFVYNRPDHTKQTLEALSANTLASESDLIIFADGPKENATQEQIEKIRQTREVVKSKQWCKSVEIRESDINKGLAASIIGGVTEIVNKFGKIIVLEDDIVTGKYFLEYMNTALEKYKDEKKVWDVSGWNENPNKFGRKASFFLPVNSCWSWATWSDRWCYFKKDPAYYMKLFSNGMIKKFNVNNSYDFFSQIESNYNGTMNTWAIFWYAAIFEHGGLSLRPSSSLVKNIGFDNSGEHCGSDDYYNRLINDIDCKIDVYPDRIEENKKALKLFSKGYIKRLYQKVISIIKNIFAVNLL